MKAQRIVDWLKQNQGSTGLPIGGHVAVPRAQLQPAQLDKVTGRSTAVVPFEKFPLLIDQLPLRISDRSLSSYRRDPGPATE